MMASSPNLDLVRSIFANWERGDYSSAEWADPEIEYVEADGPAPGRWTGRDGMAEAARRQLDAWTEFRFEADQYREIDSERILVLFYQSGRGKASGLDVGQLGSRGAALFNVRDGRVIKYVFYWDGDRALADLGLAPH